MKDKIKRLYEDWKEAKNIKYVKEANSLLERTTKHPAYFNKFVKYLGPDGDKIKSYFNESQEEFGLTSVKAKRRFASFLLEEKEEKEQGGSVVNGIDLSWMPITDRSKSVVSAIQTGTPSGAQAEILRAIVGGNMYLAAQLTAQSWGKLSVADRNLIMQLAQLHGNYNTGNTAPKDSGHTNFYEIQVKSDVDDDQKIEKKSDLKKKDFLKQAFPLTDIDNMKL